MVVLDSGVNAVDYGGGNNAHPALAGTIWTNPNIVNGVDNDGDGLSNNLHGWDYLNNDNRPEDDFGHGTAVAGVIAAAPFTKDEDGSGPAPTGAY